MSQVQKLNMNNLIALCKRRGFVFPSSEIYGGLNGFWDYGPLGVTLKNTIRDIWWRDMVLCPPIGPSGEFLNIVGIDSSIILNPETWKASGHLDGFSDQMVDCHETKNRYRADHLLCTEIFGKLNGNKISLGWLSALEGDNYFKQISKKANKLAQQAKAELEELNCQAPVPYTELPQDIHPLVFGPDASQPGTLTEPRQFNLMFQTLIGALQSEKSKAYLRPETAQGIFLNFKNVLDTMRLKPPFGIAQVGKSFRNEVTPRNFIFRSREFEQMEMEWFCLPEESQKWYDFWVEIRLQWWRTLGIKTENLRRREHEADELSHYSTACADIEYHYPFTTPNFGELEGIAHRGDYDLRQHQLHSKTKLEFFDAEERVSYIPHVIEPASGLTRAMLAVLCDAYSYDKSRPSPEFLKLHPRLAPIKAGVFPLVNKEGMLEIAQKLYLDLRCEFACQFDVKQSIGKRYARMDEIGTPFCFTVDGTSLEDSTVTVRYRDSGTQERIDYSRVKEFLYEYVSR